MEREAVKVLSGTEYDHLFPRALMTTIVKKENATVADTIKLIPQIVQETRWQTHKIAQVLKGVTLEETCRNIWEFVYHHIAYKKDENGKEQVRSPARTWHDRHNFQKDENGNYLRDEKGNRIPGGVDCDCGSTLISSILSNLKIRHRLRIVKFADSLGITNSHYSHIYPVVPKPDGGYYTIDFVVNKFNYEEPFREKHDTNMDLEYLNGVYNSDLKTAEALEMAGMQQEREELAELGKLFKRKSSGGDGAPAKHRTKLKEVLKKGGIKQVIKNNGGIKKIAGKFLNLTNKLNPAVVPLRLGLLAAMKINFFKIGSRIKYAYLSDDEARKRGVDMTKFARLKTIKDKIENIFYGAGGKREALKEAILKGRGNKNRDVLAGLGYEPENLMGADMNTPLSQLLGQSYYDEVSGFEGLEGLGELGEPATAATITAATGVLAAIAGLLKQVGNIFPKKTKGSQDFEEAENATTDNGTPIADQSGSDNNTPAPSDQGNTTSNTSNGNSNPPASDNTPTDNSTPPASNNSSAGQSSGEENTNTGDGTQNDGGDNSNLPATTDDNQSENAGSNQRSLAKSGTPTTPTTETFWQKHKSWMLPSGIGLAVVLISIGGYMALKKPKVENQHPALQPAMSGTPPKKRKRNNGKKKGGAKPKIKSKKKEVVAFI